MPSNDTSHIYSSEYRNGSVTPTAASAVTYDGTESGLSATNVQAAIDEVVSDIPTIPATYDADDIVYDNTTSGLTATDVQSAIDEIADVKGLYGLKETDLTVDATGDGVKTVQALLYEVAQQLQTIMGNLADDELLVFTSFHVSGQPSVGASISHFKNVDSTAFRKTFTGGLSSEADMVFISGAVSTTESDNYAIYWRLSSSPVEKVSRTTEVLASGSKVTITYDIYKKV